MQRYVWCTISALILAALALSEGFEQQTQNPMMWFTRVFGFVEPGRYKEVRSLFRIKKTQANEITLITRPTNSSSTSRTFYVGKFDTPSLSDLQQMLAINNAAGKSTSGKLSFCHTVGDVGILHRDPSNQGAVFQAASQFNCLEMVSPYVSPEDGISNYVYDRTQGPTCAMACPAATLFRNYFVNDHGQGGSDGSQIDLLRDMGAILGNDRDQYWRMQNGYAMPTTGSSIEGLNAAIQSGSVSSQDARSSLRVGVQWDTAVVSPHQHNVTQVYCSALPIGYHSTPTAAWEPFAQLVLDGLYEATLQVAAILARQRDKRIQVYLTMVGGGVFMNSEEWIAKAIHRALGLHKDAPIDVALVHYGQQEAFYLQQLPEIIPDITRKQKNVPDL